MLANASSRLLLACLLAQRPTRMGTGNGTPEVPELPSAWGYSWATLSGGYKYGEIECWRGPAANLLY
jgi:hypothetical protein